MAKSNIARNVTRISGEWICRDLQGWRVKVPCQGGHKYFSYAEYGGSVKALNAARAFHAKAMKQLKEDRDYEKKHGEKPYRPTINARNRSGYAGISVMYTPNLSGRPLVTYVATWSENGRQFQKRFSSAQFKGHAEYALEAAIKHREKMMKRKRK